MSTWPSEAMRPRTDRVPGVLLRRLNVTLAIPWELANLRTHSGPTKAHLRASIRAISKRRGRTEARTVRNFDVVGTGENAR